MEVKNGSHSHLTPNQKIVFPKLQDEKTPFIPFGKKAMKVPFFEKLVPGRNFYDGKYRFLIIKYK